MIEGEEAGEDIGIRDVRGPAVGGEDCGVDVTVVCPGFTRTPLIDNTRYRSDSYEAAVRNVPSWYGLTPERVARVAVRSIERRRGTVYLGWECVPMRLKQIAPRLFDAYNGMLEKKLLGRR